MIAPSLRKPAALLTALAALIGSAAFAQDTQPQPAPTPAPADAAPPVPAAEKVVHVKMITNMGEMVIELNAEKAPITVANFLKYADKGHYDNTVFHRIIPNFMIQGGGFGLGYIEKPTEAPIQNEWGNGLKNVKYSIAMARRHDPHSATAQFFINTVDNPRLDAEDQVTAQSYGGAGYAVFGKVIAGTGVVDAIKAVPTIPERAVGNQPAPAEPVVITKVERISGEGLADAVRAADASVEGAKADLARRNEAKKKIEDAGRQAFAEMGKALGTPEEQFTKAMDFLKARGVDVTPGAKSSTGLWSVETQAGEGAQPVATDRVKVHYTGWLVNGNKFDSSVDRGIPAEFPLNGVIAGWTEGVGAMKAGSKRFLVIPYELAYGAQGRPPVIPPAATLIFEVELIEVIGK